MQEQMKQEAEEKARKQEVTRLNTLEHGWLQH
jgi:hypothetical protein